MQPDNCDCCSGRTTKSTPVKIENLPGQDTLSYRVGTYSKFRDSMLASISSSKALSVLTTRDASSDLAIALIESWAIIGHILAFYDERNANEGFLRTATERRSILELANTIGYKLRPGKAATTFLAFSLEDSQTQEQTKTTINIGTKVQSLPGESEMPQIFETVEKIEALPEWNSLRIIQTKKQTIDLHRSNTIYLQGLSTQLKSGDAILIVKKDVSDPAKTFTSFRIVSKVVMDDEKQRTAVELLEDKSAETSETSGDNFETQVYAFRIKAGILGNGAPSYNSMPDTVKQISQNWDIPALDINRRREPNPETRKFDFTSDPAVVEGSGGRIDVFIRGGDNSLLHRYFDGVSWHNWELLGGPIASSPSAIWLPSGELNVFAQGRDDRLWMISFATGSGRWSSWNRVEPAADEFLMGSAPAADLMGTLMGTDILRIFARGKKDGRLYFKRRTLGVEDWQKWAPLEAEIIGAPGAKSRKPDITDIFARSGGGILKEISWDSDHWTDFHSLSEEDRFIPSSTPAVHTGEPEHVQVFARGNDGHLWWQAWYHGKWSGWIDLGGNLTSAPSAISHAGTQGLVFFVDANRSLSYKWYDEDKGQWGSTPDDHIETLDRGLPVSEFRDVYWGEGGKLIYLDNSYPSILPTSSGSNESWIALQSPDVSSSSSSVATIYKVQKTIEESVVEFGSSSKVTGIVVDIADVSKLSSFKMRKSSVYAQSEKLALAEVPIEEPIEEDSVIIITTTILSSERTASSLLSVGHPVAITGETVDDKGRPTGIVLGEIAYIAKIEPIGDNKTKLSFKSKLKNSYKREGLILNANVAKATHGQTKTSVLGGGDPSIKLQTFMLKEKPVTYISAPNQSGAKSTLEIRVNDMLWKESPSLYALRPSDRAYVIDIDSESQSRIYFGDSIHGSRPPAGLENIKAKYRVGLGMEGMLKAGQLSILMDMPLGVRSVKNVVPTSGAADPENPERARQNAPLTVLTMDRIVSLTDYENFARAFAGIGKAHSMWIWDGEKRIVYLTIASEEGTKVDPGSELYQHLNEAINKYKDPVARFKIGDPEIKSFNVKAAILVLEEGFEFKKVKLEVEETLKRVFSYEARQFGQSITLSEVISTIQRVEGVSAVKIDSLYLTEEAAESYNELIPSKAAYWDDVKRKVIPAELVILNSQKGEQGIIITNLGKEEPAAAGASS
jgi:hypothetical protein